MRLLLAVGPCALASLLPAQSGSWSTEFAPPGIAGRVFSFATWRGELYAGGHVFSPLGGPFHSTARFDGLRWRDVGGGLTAAAHFTTRVRGMTVWNDGVGGVFSGTTGTQVRALHAFGNELIVGGEFSYAGSDPGSLGPHATANVAAFDGNGWRGLGPGLGCDGTPAAFVPFRGGMVMAGNFGQAGDVVATHVAFFDGVAWNDDLIVSGGFRNVDGRPLQGIARWDGTSWQSFGSLYAVPLAVCRGQVFAGVDASLSIWNGTAFSSVATVPAGVISNLHVHTDGHLYLSADSAFRHEIHRWDGTSLTSIGAPNSFVHCVGSHGTDLVAGGHRAANHRPRQGTAGPGAAIGLIDRPRRDSLCDEPATSPLGLSSVAVCTDLERALVRQVECPVSAHANLPLAVPTRTTSVPGDSGPSQTQLAVPSMRSSLSWRVNLALALRRWSLSSGMSLWSRATRSRLRMPLV